MKTPRKSQQALPRQGSDRQAFDPYVHIIVICLTILVCSCRSRNAQAPTHFSLPANTENLVLRGIWKFHAGDTNPQYFLDSLNGFWQTQPVPRSWSQTGNPTTSIAWYRTRLELPETLDRSQNWALAFRQFVSAAEIYWDGRLLAHNGKVGVTKNEEVPGREDHIFVIPAEALQPGSHTLALRVSNHHWYDGGMFQPPEFGRYEVLLQRHETRKTFNGFFAGLFLLFGIFQKIFHRAKRCRS